MVCWIIGVPKLTPYCKPHKNQININANRAVDDPETYKRLKRILFIQTKRDGTQFFEEILFFLSKYNAKTNKQITCLLPVEFLQKEDGTRLKLPLQNLFPVLFRLIKRLPF